MQLTELYNELITESHKKEQAQQLLADEGLEDDFNQIRETDPTDQNLFMHHMAYFYAKEGVDLDALKITFEKYKDVYATIGGMQFSKKGPFFNKDNEDLGIKGGEKLDFNEFSRIVDEVYENEREEESDDTQEVDLGDKGALEMDGEAKKDILAKSHDSNIYLLKAYSQKACIKYGGKTSHCITDPRGGYYYSYRERQESTFHFVIDYSQEYPLSIVIIDVRSGDNVVVTDMRPREGQVADPYNPEKDASNETYFSYLAEKGIDVHEYIKHIPFTDEEEDVIKTIQRAKKDNEAFKKLIGNTHKVNDEYVDLTLEFVQRYGLDGEKFEILKDSKYVNSDRMRTILDRLIITQPQLTNSLLEKLNEYGMTNFIRKHVENTMEEKVEINPEELKYVDQELVDKYIMKVFLHEDV